MSFITSNPNMKVLSSFYGFSSKTSAGTVRDIVSPPSTGYFRMDYEIPVEDATDSSYIHMTYGGGGNYFGASSTSRGGTSFVIKGTAYIKCTTTAAVTLNGMGCSTAFPTISLVKVADL